MQDVDEAAAPRMPGGASGAVPPVRDEDDDTSTRDFVTPPWPRRSGRADGERVRALTEDLHEADVGDLLEALEPEDRPRLIELLGRDFDFTALTEVDEAVREEILEELEPSTVAEGVRELDSDDAVYDPRETSTRRTRPRSSTSCRRPSASPCSARSTIRRTRPVG